jgi:hypothetical protein
MVYNGDQELWIILISNKSKKCYKSKKILEKNIKI